MKWEVPSLGKTFLGAADTFSDRNDLEDSQSLGSFLIPVSATIILFHKVGKLLPMDVLGDVWVHV